jgi:peptidoglycan/xylan/chitin deacetylase (PgdA/CDA1 family)
MVKRLIKVLVSTGYLLVRALYFHLRGKKRSRQPGCIVLYYHKILSRERAAFAAQMDMLARWTTPIRLDRAGELNGSTRCSAVTFDDAFQNVVDNALPELEKRKIPATIFVPSGFLGKQAGWMDRAGETNRVMSAEVMRSLPPDLITIGSHTVTHPKLPRLSSAEARAELAGSRDQLEQALGRPVTLLAFPYGRYSREIVQLCREAGYTRVFTGESAPAFRTPGEFVAGRVAVTPGDWPWEFKLKLRGAYAWVPAAMRWKRRSR